VRDYYVYIMTNNSGTLYVGVTNNLIRRVAEHKAGTAKGFTSRYKMTRLVYFEVGGDAIAAIEREKQIKGWVRRRKIALVAAQNPKWRTSVRSTARRNSRPNQRMSPTTCHSEPQRRISPCRTTTRMAKTPNDASAPAHV
jgi:Predicted endonuclease containing a URI domain